MWCALDDWKPDPNAVPICVFVPSSIFPLAWTATGPRTVSGAQSIPDTWRQVALAAHWAQEHPDQLRAFVGDFELHHGITRPSAPAKYS